MAEPKGAERRRFPRKPQPAGWEVKCTRDHEPEPRNLSRRLIDLSPGGASLETEIALEQGEEVTLALSALQGYDRFKAIASVCWSKSVKSDGSLRHLVGLRMIRVLNVRGDSFAFIAGTGATPAGAPDPRRQVKRFFPPGAAVEVNTPGLLGRIGLGKASTRLQDLSRGGIRISSSKKLAPGSIITVVIELLRPAVRLVAPGEVKWCKPDTDHPERGWVAGIAFVKVSPDDEEVLRTVDKFYLP